MTGLTMFFFGGLWTLVLWVRKAVEWFKHCLKGHTVGAWKMGWGVLNVIDELWGSRGFRGEECYNVLVCVLETGLVIFWWRKWVLFCFWFLRQGFSVQLWLSWNSLSRPGWPHTHRDPPASASWVLGLKAYITTVQLLLFALVRRICLRLKWRVLDEFHW